jgi:hypothetical protein
MRLPPHATLRVAVDCRCELAVGSLASLPMSNDEILVWTAFARWLGERGIHLEVREGLELQQRLFAIPAYGTRLPWRGCPWLPTVDLLGKSPRPSALVAFRLNAIHARFLHQPWPTINELLALASAEPGKMRTLRAVLLR